MPNRRSISHLLAVAVCTLLIFYADFSGSSWLQRGELFVQDKLMELGRAAPVDPRVVFLAIDTSSATLDKLDRELIDLDATDADSRRALDLMIQEWPWSRDVYALILNRLMQAGARSVAFDVTFPKPSPHDDEFRDSLERHRDHVVVAGNFTDPDDGEPLTFVAPAATLIPQVTPRDSRIGYDNFWADPDGAVRHAQYRWAIRHGVWEGGEEFSLAARALAKAGYEKAIPPSRQSHRLRLAGPRGTFSALPVHQIFVPKYWKGNCQSGALFKDKIIVIGATGNWQHDDHPTALGVMNGAELQANAISAALQGEFLRQVSWETALGIFALTGLLAAGCCLACKAPLLRVGVLLGAGAIWVAGQFALFDRSGILLPVTGPLGILVFTGFFSITYDLVCAGAEHLRLRRTIAERKRAEEILQRANDELERRVQERTVELSRSNDSLKALLNEKDILLKEIHHRVKNNLQIISSLLNLQAGSVKDPAALELFMETRHRVRSMSLIHEKLYQSGDLARIDFADYLKTLTSGLASSFAGPASAVRISVDVDEIMLGVDSAVPCGLIVNELVTNCFKYAFTGGRAGEINVRMKRAENTRLQLSVADNGAGFPKGVNFRETESLGMQLITTLTEQLDGDIELINGTGTKFEITFPEATH